MARKSSTASSPTTKKTSKRPAKRSKDSPPARAPKKASSSKKTASTKKPAAPKKPASTTKKASVPKSTAADKKSSSKRAAGEDTPETKTKKKPAGGSAPAKGSKAAAPAVEAAPAKPAKPSKSKPAKAPAVAAAPAPKPAKEAKPKAAPKPAKSGKSKKAASSTDASGPAPAFRGFRQSNTLTEIRAAAAKLASAAGLPAVKSGPDTDDASQKKFRKVTKSPLSPKQLAEFRDILVLKRRQLEGDVSGMELEALRGGAGGSLSHLPQHMADQGSDVFEQSLSLDLAASQRDIIKEIDAALARIENGTFGICELLGKPIRTERLRETPWARYSIEAARDLERRGYVDRSRNQA